MAQITYPDFVGGETTQLPAALNEIKAVVNAGGGTGTGISAVNVQENGVAVGAEDTINFEDGTNFSFTVTTDGAVVKVRGDATTTASVWRNGTGAPSNTLGINGDYYLNTTTGSGKGDVYKKAAGVYGIVGNIAGAIGATGATGAAGAPGTITREGAGVPDNAIGVDGDYYINTSNADLYKRVAGVYGVVGNLAYAHTHTAEQISDATAAGRALLTAADAAAQKTALALAKADVGLGNVDNTSDANKPVSTAQQAALDGKASATDLTTHTANTSNPHNVTKTQVGLGNADNTSDATKNSAAATLTNKRITRRVTSEVSSATPTPNVDNADTYILTALAVAAAFGAPLGTPTEEQHLELRIKDNGAAQGLSWNAIYRAVGVTLPATTVAGKVLRVGMIWNAEDVKYDVVAIAQLA